MSVVAELIVKIGADIRGLSTSLDAASTGLEKMAAGFAKTSAHFQRIGVAMTAAGGVITAGLGAAVSKAMDFEAQMSKVQALSGGSAEDFDRLRKSAIQLGADTGFSATQAAEGMQNFAAAGFKTSEVLDAMPGLLAAAAAGGDTLANTSDIMVTAIGGFGLEAKDAAHVADVLASASNDSAISISDLGQSFKFIAPIANTLNISMEDTAAALAIMGNAGIKGSEGGTALRAALSSLVAPSNAARQEMEALGLSVTDSKGQMLPFSEILGALQSKFAGMTDAQKAASAATLFGREAMSGMLVLIDKGPEALGKLSSAYETNKGSAQAMADIMTNNLKGAMDSLSGAFESAQISIGTALAPAIRAAADALTVLVNMFNALPEPLQQSIAIGAALTAGFLLIGGAVSLLISLWPAFLGGLATLTGALAAILSPVGLVIAAIVAIGAAIVAWIAQNEQARANVAELWDAIVQVFNTATELIGAVLGAFFDNTASWWGEWLGLLLEQAGAVFNSIVEAITWGLNLASDTMALITAIMKGDWAGALDALGAMSVDWQVLTEHVFKDLASSLSQIWETMTTVLSALWAGFMTGAEIAFTALWNGITSIAGGIADTLVSVFKSAVNIVVGLINSLIGLWNSLRFDIPPIDMGPLGVWGGFSVGVPQIPPIPQLAMGGLVTQAGAALVGERGPELLDLPRGASVAPLSSPGLATAGGGGITYNITVTGSVIRESEIWDIARRGGIKHRRSNLAGDLS